MPFDPTLPATNSDLKSAEMRDQFNGLKDLIDAGPSLIGPAGLRITGNTEMATTIGLVFLKADGTTDTGYRINWNDDTEAVLILHNGNPVTGFDAEGFRVWEAFKTYGAVETYGPVKLTGLPASDPHEDGRLWNDAGTLKISAG